MRSGESRAVVKWRFVKVAQHISLPERFSMGSVLGNTTPCRASSTGMRSVSDIIHVLYSPHG